MVPYSSFPMLLSSFSLGHLKLMNRIVHTPVVTRLENEDGSVTPSSRKESSESQKGVLVTSSLGQPG